MRQTTCVSNPVSQFFIIRKNEKIEKGKNKKRKKKGFVPGYVIMGGIGQRKDFFLKKKKKQKGT